MEIKVLRLGLIGLVISRKDMVVLGIELARYEGFSDGSCCCMLGLCEDGHIHAVFCCIWM